MSWGLGGWYARLPPRDKQSLLTMLVFVLILAMFIALTVTEDHYNKTVKHTSVYPSLVVKLGHLAAAVGVEAESSISFSLQPTEVNLYNEMVATRAASDVAYSESFSFIEESTALHSWDSSYPFADGGTIMTEQGLGPLLTIRSQLVFGEVVFDSQATRFKYLDVITRIVGIMATCSHAFREDVDYASLVEANALMAVVDSFLSVEYHTQLYRYYVRKEISDPTMADAAVNELKLVLSGLLAYQSISQYVLRPLLAVREQVIQDVKTAAFDLDEHIHTFTAEATKQQFLPDDYSLIEYNTAAKVREVLVNLASENEAQRSRIYKSSVSTKVYWYIACSILSGVAFLASALELLHLRLFEAKGSALQRHNAGIMYDVLVRIAEYVEQIATFSLAPLPPPFTMTDRKVSIVEMEMQYLLGTLRSVATALPPLLFPKRLLALAAEYSDVKDPATMVLCPPMRNNLQDEKMRIQTTDDPHPYLSKVAESTDLQERICDAALLFVSLTAFHDLGSLDKRKFAADYYQRVVSIVEECVFQHGGIMHSVSFDKAVAVWNVEELGNGQVQNAYGSKAGFCELAATCGLSLANRLGMLCAQKSVVRENFPLHIGIVGGTVDVGIFGSELSKTVGIFGPPVLRGMLVAQANGFHATSVACDDYICQAIQRMCFCKPMELLPSGGCAYQILSEATHDESDMEMQLLTYTKAFELFERRHYKGALKAFRAYTKQYGYDSSVERIQYLINNMQA